MDALNLNNDAKLWVLRETEPAEEVGEYGVQKVRLTGRAFVMRSPDSPHEPTQNLGVFDSFDAAMKIVRAGNAG